MRPLQDQCYPTALPKLDEMLRKDMQMSMDDLFSDFDPEPIGVASVSFSASESIMPRLNFALCSSLKCIARPIVGPGEG